MTYLLDLYAVCFGADDMDICGWFAKALEVIHNSNKYLPSAIDEVAWLSTTATKSTEKQIKKYSLLLRLECDL